MAIESLDKLDTGTRSADPELAGQRAYAATDFVHSRQDLLHRFTSLSYSANLRVMRRTVRLESNSESILKLAMRFFAGHQHGMLNEPEFVWRLVCEPDPKVQSTDVRLTGFSDLGVRYINIGQRGFLAVDLERREATGFLAGAFLEGEPRLRHRPPLDILLCMTTASLGLTALCGGCIARNGRGVLVFGPPNSGKTTACYHASRIGMEYQADQVVFLDMIGGRLQVWGDPFPAVFRPGTVEFCPELKHSARRSNYAEHSFYYFDKSSLQPCMTDPIDPVCSLFLERCCPGDPRLQEIPPRDASARLRGALLFDEDSRFDEQVLTALDALSQKPSYSLQYGNDPKTAATFVERLLR